MNGVFRDRVEAGQFLAPLLRAYARRDDVIVVAVARGGVPVGFEIASRLHVPLEVLVVRKVGLPTHPALAMGAVASEHVELRDRSVISAYQISTDAFEAAAREERREVEREEHIYRDGRPAADWEDKIVLLVDDGILTGWTMRAAVRAVELKRPRSIVVVAPVAAAAAVDELKREGAEVVAVLTPKHLGSIAEFYGELEPITADEVMLLLTRAAGRSGLAGALFR